MGFLKQFFRTVIREGSLSSASGSIAKIEQEALREHLSVSCYGKFQLTDAIRPSFDLQIIPEEGIRRDLYIDPATGMKIPVLMAAVSQEKLFDTFLDLLDPLGNVVDVVLETSHSRYKKHKDLIREGIDLPVLKSALCDFEDLLMNDGCTGVAVLNPTLPYEVQFDEHKLLIVYGTNLRDSENIFHFHRISSSPDLRFLTEAEHIHSSRESFHRKFNELCSRLNIDLY